MKTYVKPELEIVEFVTENITSFEQSVISDTHGDSGL